jgi:indolepyruvate decarboxylase
VAERARDPLLHHRVRDFSTQRDIFSHITVAVASLEDPQTAYQEIDRVLLAIERYKRPGFIELPRDRVHEARQHRPHLPTLEEMTDADALSECMAEAVGMINSAKRPVILADVEVHRFGLQNALLELVGKTAIPVAATLLGKSVISERHPFYLGVYAGAMGRDEVRRYVESADCLLMLGCFMSDINLGIFTADLDPARAIYATSDKLMVRRHRYENVPFPSFFKALLDAPLRRRAAPAMPKRKAVWGNKPARENSRVTVRALFQAVNEFLADDMVVISDIGDALFAAADLTIHRRTEFLSPAYYTSMGFAVPSSIGAQLANRKLRPLVLVGDGAFQMTGMELSTAARRGLNPIVIVLNNHGYGTERIIKDGPFNDIAEWEYCKLPELLKGGQAFHVRTVADLRAALDAALRNTKSYSLLEVELAAGDISPALQRLGARLAQRVKGRTGRGRM